ncbi:MAG: hypothetical protein PHG29_07870 [Prolixibacteraceae bacterium]|jgi:outer membrane receptor for ferrienterochelin and colicins|nr:hypothetical protein [Prolixibacteraceae bacterium]
MLVPHFGLTGDSGTPENDLLFTSPGLIELNLKLAYIFELRRLDSSLELFGGSDNLLTHYQNDLDTGKNRDSGYLKYGLYKNAEVCRKG